MGYIVGIDQGGTKTHSVVMDRQGSLLGDYKTEGCYFPRDGIKAAMEVVARAVRNTLDNAIVNIDDVEMIVAGITGIDYEGDETLVKEALQTLYPATTIIVCNDCEIAYYSGTLNPIGAVICAGTGINAALFAPNGDKFVMSDYLKNSLQGGVAIAQRALEAVMDSDLGALPATALTQVFLDFSHEEVIYEVLRRFITESDFAIEMISLVPKIIETADNGDQVARDVLNNYSAELCRCFVAALNKMGMLKLDCDVVLAGSVFKGPVNYLVEIMTKDLLEKAPNINIINAGYEPVVGACILGMIKLNGSFEEKMDERTKLSGEKLGLLRSSPEIK